MIKWKQWLSSESMRRGKAKLLLGLVFITKQPRVPSTDFSAQVIAEKGPQMRLLAICKNRCLYPINYLTRNSHKNWILPFTPRLQARHASTSFRVLTQRYLSYPHIRGLYRNKTCGVKPPTFDGHVAPFLILPNSTALCPMGAELAANCLA
jgi:hypothetical protein